MRALISFSSLLSAAICRLTSPLSVRMPRFSIWLAAGPRWTEGILINAPALVAAVVYQRRLTGGLQCPVGIGCHAARQISTFPLSFQSVVSSRWFFQPPFPSGIRWPFSSRSYALRHFAPHAPFFFQGPDGQHDMDMGGCRFPCRGWQSQRTSPCPQSCPSHRPGQGQAAAPWTVRGAKPPQSRGQAGCPWLSRSAPHCSRGWSGLKTPAGRGRAA